MKIIFITREGYNLPGARIRCYNFSRELSRYGVETEVLSFSDTLGAKDGGKESQMGIRDKIKFNYLAFKKLSKCKNTIFYLQRFNYHSFAPYLAYILNSKNRLILDLDDWEMRENPKYYFGLFPSSKAHYFTKQIAEKSVLCIAASKFLQDFLQQFNNKVYLIPSGVDTELFNPCLNNGRDEKKVVFAWIGTLHKKEYIENIAFSLGCFHSLRKKYSHIYFDIVGDGIYRNDVIEIINRFKDSNIRLKGWIPPRNIPAYLKDIHIGLFPVAKDTKFNRAKSPTKLFEYMAMEKPTVSSNIGEIPHIIHDGDNGFLADTKEKFIESMQRLAENPLLRKKIGLKARETVESNYSLNILGKRLFEAIRTI